MATLLESGTAVFSGLCLEVLAHWADLMLLVGEPPPMPAMACSMEEYFKWAEAILELPQAAGGNCRTVIGGNMIRFGWRDPESRQVELRIQLSSNGEGKLPTIVSWRSPPQGPIQAVERFLPARGLIRLSADFELRP
ncbi:MAG: hypothetical protein KDD44_13850 [Bdellovibrionales bacterium]|nr:hypothetical protein [Bdellovibrionales bacterium]